MPMKTFTVQITVANPARVEALIKAESRSNGTLEEMVTSWAQGGYERNVRELEEKYGYAVDGKALCAKCNKAFRPFKREPVCNQCS